MKTIWIPHDFDADKEDQQAIVSNILKESIVEDILFNVVFGNLTEQNVQFFLNASGLVGLNLALLHEIGTGHAYHNVTTLSKHLGVSSSPIREKIILLEGAGFITGPSRKVSYSTTVRGRVFLDLVTAVITERHKNSLSLELIYILSKLNCAPPPALSYVYPKDIYINNPYHRLSMIIEAAEKQWNLDLTNVVHRRPPE